jgi:hypothetical protein
MKKLSLVLVALVVTGSSCGLFFPFGLDALADTRIGAICRFAYNCCTPAERAVFLNSPPFKDEGACRAEAAEDRNFGGGFYTQDLIAKDAVARGAAEYDGEAAERCSRAQLEAMNACDPEAVFNSAGQIDFVKFSFLVDPTDAECFALAQRSFARGLVDDGDECFSDIDCADFGVCVPEEGNEDTLTTAGECLKPHEDGDECIDARPCAPGLLCQQPEGGGTPVCSEPVLKDDGEDCFQNAECESGLCEQNESGTCFIGQTPCVDDTDCVDAGDFCNIDFNSVCAPAPDVTLDMCNGPD